MARPAENALPGKDAVEYIGAWIAIGGVFGYVAWATVRTLWPEQDPDLGTWTLVGAGLAGVASMSWVLSSLVLY
jgi:hypothetical protein